MGRSTDSDFWAVLGGLAIGLALSGSLRWGRRHGPTRRLQLGLGLNLAALAGVGAIIASGAEPGGLEAQVLAWVWPFGLAAVFGLLVFRFPRSAGIPLVVLAGACLWLAFDALKEFRPLPAEGEVLRRVQPLTDAETVTLFALRADKLAVGLYRYRVGDSEPTEWWWPWVVSRGWAQSLRALAPATVIKYAVYRLELSDSVASWVLERPDLFSVDSASNPVPR